MNDVAELKEYALVHAVSLRIAHHRRLLGRIRTDADGGPGSWAGEWSQVAERLEAQGRHLAAARHYAMARFPFVNGSARQLAAQRCVSAFERWRAGQPAIEPLEVTLKDGNVRCWTSGLSTDGRRRPLLVAMGGIVSVKEQLAPMLATLHRLGMAGLVAEMPGIGENGTRYTPESWRMLSGLLDAVADRADATRTYAIALSFSGHLALQCAVNDNRIKAVITAGAPVSRFFTDTEWQRGLPRVTVDTLAHIGGSTPGEVIGNLSDWALDPNHLASLNIPVSYMASLRDEIIPAEETRVLRRHVRDFHLVERDDIHGLPRHITETKLWTMASLLRARGVRSPQSRLLELLLRCSQLQSRLVVQKGRPHPRALASGPG